MKIFIVVGSKRKGNSYAMASAAADVINKKDYEFIDLSKLSMNFCDGCLKCDESGNCHYDDDITKIIEHIKQADGFIFASPTRWSLLSGELKTFFDRLNPLALSGHLNHKKAAIFVVGQTKEGEDESISRAVNSIQYFCDNAQIEVIGICKAYSCIDENDIVAKNPHILDECKRIALDLVNSIVNESN